MKWNEALLKSYSSLQHDPHSFQNNPSDMTKQYYLLLVVPITLMKKTGFSPLTYFSFLQGKRKKMHWNCTRLCYSSSLLADLWWKMSQLVFGYSNMYSNSYLFCLSIFCLQIHMQLKGKGLKVRLYNSQYMHLTLLPNAKKARKVAYCFPRMFGMYVKTKHVWPSFL